MSTDQEWMPTVSDDSTRRALEALASQHVQSTGEECGRCGHGADDHKLNDALNLSPTDASAPFRCTFGIAGVRLCLCPDFVEGQ